MPQPHGCPEREVYLKNLPKGVLKKDVVDLLQRVGRPTKVYVFPSKDGVTTVAVATMESREAAHEAIRLPRPGGVIIEPARPKAQPAPRPASPRRDPARGGYVGSPRQRAPVSPPRVPQPYRGMHPLGGARAGAVPGAGRMGSPHRGSPRREYPQGRAARAPDRAPPARAPAHKDDEPPVGAAPMLSNTMSDMDRQLYLVRVPMEWTEADVKGFLSCGREMQVRKAYFPPGDGQARTRGKVARAEMITTEAARRAIECLNGQTVGADGLRISIEYQTPTKVDPRLRSLMEVFRGQYPTHKLAEAIKGAERRGYSGKDVVRYAGEWLSQQQR